MQTPLSRSMVLSIMVAHLFASIALGAFILICIAFHCTFVNVYTFVDGCTLTLVMSSSLVPFCVICASTNCCSTTLFSFDFSMYTKSTDVALGLVCSLALQPFLCLHKNSTLDVPDLYIL